MCVRECECVRESKRKRGGRRRAKIVGELVGADIFFLEGRLQIRVNGVPLLTLTHSHAHASLTRMHHSLSLSLSLSHTHTHTHTQTCTVYTCTRALSLSLTHKHTHTHTQHVHTHVHIHVQCIFSLLTSSGLLKCQDAKIYSHAP